jgi:hypothetical protein
VDEIPELPKPEPEGLMEHPIDINEFLNAKNRFLIYSAPDGEPRLRFDSLDDELYATGVAILSAPWNKKALEMLKLILEGVRLVTDFKKKNFDGVIRVEKYLQQTISRNKADAQKELSWLPIAERWKLPGETERGQESMDDLRKEIQGIKPTPEEPPQEPFKDTLF